MYIRQNCICISFQLGAKGDVELRRGKNGGLVLPSKLIVGTQSLTDLVAGIVLKSKNRMTHQCIIHNSSTSRMKFARLFASHMTFIAMHNDARAVCAEQLFTRTLVRT